MNKNDTSLPEQTHETMHRIPGVPEHTEAEHLNHRGGLPNRPYLNEPLENKPLPGIRRHHANREPKVLVSWQQKIAKFFGVEHK
jgi:hypothetical protein